MADTDVGRVLKRMGRAEDSHEAVVAFLRDLIRMPTHSPAGLGSAADRVELELRSLDLEPKREDVVRPGEGPAPVVTAWLGPETRTPALILVAHTDTAPPTPEWTVDPYAGARRGGRIYGRGATVAKSDVAIYVHALAAARDALRDGIAGSALVAITSDEGGGGNLAAGYLLDTLGLRPERALCAGFTYGVGIAHNGAVQVRLTVRGRGAHQAIVDPGAEAMRAAVAIAAGVVAEGDRIRAGGCSIAGIESPTLNVSSITGGTGFGMAPGTVELLLDRRVTPDEDVDAALAALVDVLESLPPAQPGVSVSTEIVQRVEPLRPTPEQGRWAECVQRIATALSGAPVPLLGIPLYTDARWFAHYGVPTVLYGAGAEDLVDAGINGVDENVRESDLATAAAVVARVVEDTLRRPS